MTTTQAPAPAIRHYVIAGSVSPVRDDYGQPTGETFESIRVLGGGYHRTRSAARQAASDYDDSGVYFTRVITAANRAGAMAAARAEDIERMRRAGVL
jgi:hypothetical protein